MNNIPNWQTGGGAIAGKQHDDDHCPNESNQDTYSIR